MMMMCVCVFVYHCMHVYVYIFRLEYKCATCIGMYMLISYFLGMSSLGSSNLHNLTIFG